MSKRIKRELYRHGNIYTIYDELSKKYWKIPSMIKVQFEIIYVIYSVLEVSKTFKHQNVNTNNSGE